MQSNWFSAYFWRTDLSNKIDMVCINNFTIFAVRFNTINNGLVS